MFAVRLVLAAVAGIGTGLAFEPTAWWFLLVLGVTGFVLALSPGPRASATARLRWRQRAVLGFAYGLGFMGVLLPWLAVIGTDAWIGLTILEALFFALLGIAAGPLLRLRLSPLWLGSAWVGVDQLRSHYPWGGFPWGQLAFASPDTPFAPAMAVVGTSGVTFLIVVLGSSLALVVLATLDSDQRQARGWATASLGLVTAVLATTVVSYSGARLTNTTLQAASQLIASDTNVAQVAAVQGNVPGVGMDAFAERRAVLNNHVEATQRLAVQVAQGTAEPPDFVLWPENSTDIDPYEDSSVYADISAAADAVGVPILVGAMVGGPGPSDVRNQGIVWAPGRGPGQSYSKTHPVPFGEYIPHRAFLARFFERLNQIPRDMVAGDRPGVLDLAGVRIGDVICFEVAYEDSIRDVVAGGAELLVVQTNNATYMETGQVEQQFAIARLRAIQAGRYVVVVATNGVSGIIDPAGQVVQRAATREQVVLHQAIPRLSATTPAMVVGQGVGITLGVLSLLGVAYAWSISRKANQQRTPARKAPH